MNKCIIDGRLTKDPVISSHKDTTNTTFTVAVDTRSKGPDGKPQTNFYRVTAWRKMGDNCAKYLHKGDKVTIIGDLALRTFTGDDGQQRQSLCVTANEVVFQTPKSSAGNSEEQQPDDELPFF